MIDYNDDLPPSLAEAVRQLREDVVAPSDLWRRRVLNDIASAPVPRAERSPSSHWQVRPMIAVAAALVCTIVGLGLGALVTGPLFRPATGDVRSALPAVSSVRFTLVAPDARRVSLVGDFNAWNPGALPLRRGADGRTWVVEVPLAPGRYTYAFMVDDAIARDPTAAQASGDDFGAPSSVVLVSMPSRSSGP